MKQFLFFAMAIMFFVMQGWTQTPATIPYSCNFEDSDENTNWVISNGTYTNQWHVGVAVTSGSITGNSLYISNDAGVTNAYANSISNVTATRTIEFTGAGGYALEFDVRVGGEGNLYGYPYDYIKVFLVDSSISYTSSNATDWSSYSSAQGAILQSIYGTNNYYCYSNQTNPTQVVHLTVILPSQGAAGTVKKLIIGWKNDGSGGEQPPACIDNISITEITCVRPTALAVPAATITTNTAEVTWTAGGTEADWTLQYKLTSDSWTNATEITNVTSGYQIPSLNPSSSYDVRVKSVCTSGVDESVWTDAVTFRTQCGAITSFPWTEGFESAWTVTTLPGNATAPDCWININNGYNSYYSWQRSTGSSYARTGNGAATMYGGYSSTYNNSDWLISPIFTLQGTEGLNFYTKSQSTSYPEDISVYILDVATNGDIASASDTSHFVRIMLPELQTTSWLSHELSLPYTGNYRIAFVRNSLPGGQYLCLDDISITEISCFRPTSLAVPVATITTNTAEVTWTAGGTESNWTLQYKLSSDDWANATEIQNVTSGDQITGLNSSSSYDVRVKSVCTAGVDESVWADATFRTQCGAITAFPWTEGFESDWTVTTVPGNATAPDCWINVNNGYNSYYKWQRTTGTSYAITGNGAATMYGGWTTSSSYTNSDWLISPTFTLQGTERLNFYTKSFSTSYPEDISIYILDLTTNGDITSAADTSDFVRIMGPELQTTSWLFHELSLPYTGNYRIAFVRNARPGGQYLCLDDITISEMPLCPNTYNLTSTLRSATEVDLNWMQNGNGNGWVIAYGDTTGFDPSSATQTITISSTDPVPYTVTGLTPQTPYSFAVRQACNGGAWSNIVSLTTPATAATLPYSHSFEGITENGAWTFINGTQTNQWTIGTAADTLGTTGLYVSNDAGVTNAYTVGTSRVYAYRDFEVPAGAGELELSFDWRAKGGSAQTDFLRMYLVPLDANITAGVIPPNGLDASAQIGNYTGGTGEHWLSQSTIWQHKTMRINSLQFPNLAGRTWRLLVHWRNESSTTTGIQPPAAVDNISLTVVTCPTPSALVASNLTTTSALLTWAENGSATDWIIEYKPSSSTTWATYQTQSNPDSIINLMPGTSYTARLRSLCSDTSLYSNTITFQTVCAPLTVPTSTEGFLNAVPPTTCWLLMQGTIPATGTATLTTTTTGWYWNSNVTAHNAKVNMFGSYNYWLISPSVDLGDGTVPAQIEFDVFYTTWNSSAVAAAAGNNRFAVVVSTDDGLTWDVANATIWSNAVGATRVLDNIPNTPTHVILPLFDPATTLPYTGNIKVGFYGESTNYNTNNDLHIDNFEVLPYSVCQRPSSISAIATANDATVSFTENGESTTWEYVYGDATTITDPTIETAISTTDNPFQLTGLTPQTQYNVWVRSVCDNGNSDWSVLSTFVTEALPATLPYTCDFESSTENLAWRLLSNGINKWAVGTAASNGITSTGTQANYISNDNGVSYAMTGGNIYSYTYRDIDFGTDPASFNLSFDWKCQGYQATWSTSLNAGLIVYLRDPSEAINTSNLPTNPNDNIGVFYNASTWQASQLLPIDNVSGIKRLMFVYFDQYYNYAPPAAIDNISLVQATCPRPADVAASNLTTTTAEISWIHPGADSYIVSYRSASDTTLTDEAAATSPYTIQGLTLGTQYLVSVRAICSGDTTIYSSTITFQTPCFDGAISSFPWAEGFENGLNCLTVTASGTAANSFWRIQQSGSSPICTPHGGSNMVQYNSYSSPNSSGQWTVMASPSLDFSTGSDMQLSFWMYRDPGYSSSIIEGVYAYVNSTPDTVGGTLLGHTSRYRATAGWDSISYTIPSTITGTQYIVLKGYSEYGNNIYVDDLTVDVSGATPCAAPTNITVPTATITNTTTTVNWTAGGSETSWQVRLDLTGTPVDVNTPTYQLPSLAPGTNYTVYVRANCGTSFSAWVSQTFTTTAGYQLPIVTTIAQTGTNQTSTTLNGSYVQGTNPVLVKGFEWKPSTSSTWTVVPVTAGTTPFSHPLSGLMVNTSYNFRAYVETSQDTTRGNTMTFTTLSNVLPNVTTTTPNPIGQTTATFNGTTAPGTEAIQARGFEYKLTATTTWIGAIDVTATGTSTITIPVTNLTASTQYDVRAYAQTLSDGKTYGNVITFTTLGLNPPTVVTLPATVTGQTTADLNGTVTAGTGTITAQGFDWRQVGTTSWTTVSGTVSGITMTHPLTGLTASTNYEYRAFATSGGTVYGLTVTFTTDAIPVVPGHATTQAATDIDTTHAMLHGTLVDVGNALSNIEVGFVYSTLTDPELGGTNVIDVPVTYTAGMTTFSAPISGLQPSTSYFFKAYVNNSAGPGYGLQETFVTDDSGLEVIDGKQFLVTMYPNPATSTTKLVVSGVEGETDIDINDVQGKLIYKTTAKAMNGKVEQTIDVNNFAKGVYYVRIQNQTTSRTQKLIVLY